MAGFSGGWTDRILSWVIDFVLSLPYLLFAIAVPAVLLAMFVGTAEDAAADDVATVRFYSLIIVLSFFGWAGLARLIRGEVLSLREREFVAAAKVLGVPTRKVLFKELLPNLVAPIVISVSMALPELHRRRGRPDLSRRRPDRADPVVGRDDRRRTELLPGRPALPVDPGSRDHRPRAGAEPARRLDPRRLRSPHPTVTQPSRPQ